MESSKQIEQKDMKNLNELNFSEFIQKYFDKKEAKQIQNAVQDSMSAHFGQFRDTGEAYYTHPLNAAIILIRELNIMKADLIAAALLHDTVEDTDYWTQGKAPEDGNTFIIKTLEAVDAKYNEEVTDMIINLTNLRNRHYTKQTSKFNQDDYYKMLVKNTDAVIVKIADRLHNLRTINDADFAKRQINKNKFFMDILAFVEKSSKAYQKKAIILGIALLRKEIEDLELRFNLK